MKIYVDADACPRAIKEILYKAAIRTQCKLILVANQVLSTPQHRLIQVIQVPHGFDLADNYIESTVDLNDLVITQDIPLAAKIVEKGALALNPRGILYTKESIKQRLSMRNFMDELRSSGIQTGGPKPLSQRDIKQFAGILDTQLARLKRLS